MKAVIVRNIREPNDNFYDNRQQHNRAKDLCSRSVLVISPTIDPFLTSCRHTGERRHGSSGSADGQQLTWTGLARSKEGALGCVWEMYDAGMIGVDATHTTGTSMSIRSGPPASTELHSHQHLQKRHWSISPNARRHTYGRRILPPRETPPTPRTSNIQR
ncbi:hypothetical protein QQ045_005751 [Rhodiola kirilowii]